MVARGWFRSLKCQVHALVPCVLQVLARMVASSLERGRSTQFEPGRSTWTLFSSQKLHQTIQFSLPLQCLMDLSGCFYLVSRHSRHFDLLSAGQHDQCRTSHELRDVQKTEDGARAGVIAVAVGLRVVVLYVCHSLLVVFELFGGLNRPKRSVLPPLLI